jgi:hypothetical protein
MKKSIIFFAAKFTLVVMIAIGIFGLGRKVGEESAGRRAEKETYLLASVNAVPLYARYAEISELIADGKINQAKCAVNLGASSYLRDVKRCLADSGCRDFILDEVKNIAPEVIDGGSRKFTFYESGEACVHDDPDKLKKLGSGVKK